MRVGAEPALVVRAVELDEGGVDGPLVERVDAVELVGDLAVHVRDRVRHALAAVAVAAVAQLDRLVLAGRRPARHRGAAERPALEERPRPRRSGCRANRGSHGRRSARSRSSGHLRSDPGGRPIGGSHAPMRWKAVTLVRSLEGSIAHRSDGSRAVLRESQAMDLHLTGKRAIVTGGSKGIGKAVARTLSAEGCDVVIAVTRPQSALEETADRDLGRHRSARRADHRRHRRGRSPCGPSSPARSRRSAASTSSSTARPSRSARPPRRSSPT